MLVPARNVGASHIPHPFTLALLAAAETTADFAGILYTESLAGGEADAAEPFEPIELEKRALLTMPGGWKMSQLQAEQPATIYDEFKRELLNEISRCLNMPFKEGVQEAVLLLTTRFPRSCRQTAALPVETQHHRVFGARGTAPANDQQVGIDLGLAEGLPQLRQSLPQSLTGLFELVVIRIQIAIGFKAIDCPLYFRQRAGAADGRSEQPEQPADLAVLAEVDAFAHAPGETRVVLVVADANVFRRRGLLAFGRCVAGLDRRLATGDLDPQCLALGPGDGPIVNLHHRHWPRFFLREPRQPFPILQVRWRIESVGKEVGIHLSLRLLNFLNQRRERLLLLGPQHVEFGLRQLHVLVAKSLHRRVEGVKEATNRFHHLAMRRSNRLDPCGEGPQLQHRLRQRLLGLGIIGDSGHERLAGSDGSFFPILVHGGGGPWKSARRRHSIALPSIPTFLLATGVP